MAHAIQRHAPAKTATVAHPSPLLNAVQVIETEAAPTTTAITEEPLRIMITESTRVIVGNGAVVRFEEGSILSDPWMVENALAHKVPHRIVETNRKMPTAITALESKYLIVNNGRGSTTVRAGERVVDPSVISAIIGAGIRFVDSSDAA